MAFAVWCHTAFALIHTVARGESLESIAHKYSITVEQLVNANPGAQNLFYVGLKLNIPEAVTVEAVEMSTKPQELNNSSLGSTTHSEVRTDNVAPKSARIDTDGNIVYHPFFAVAQYQMGDFESAKLSSRYGLGLVATSISHWGAFHVGADVCLSINAGIIDDWNIMCCFGPSMRFDISPSCFLNIPINAVFVQVIPEKEDTKYYWGAMVSPALHLFASDRFGIFVGPQFTFDSDATSVGMVAGISYAF